MKFRWGFVIVASLVNLGCVLQLMSDQVAEVAGQVNDPTQPLVLSLFFLNCLLLLSLVRVQLTHSTTYPTRSSAGGERFENQSD